MTEARFQAICTTRYIIRKLLPFSHVECPEFRATVHAAWKVIKAETQRNLVAEMYLLMVAGIKKKLAAVIATALLPPFWINADLWTSKVTKAKFYGIRIFFKKEAQLETAFLAVGRSSTGEHNALNEDQALKMTAGNVCFIEFF
jgi:hypothetical protein